MPLVWLALVLLPGAGAAAEEGANRGYIEVIQDFSLTENTARGAVGGDADGRMTAFNLLVPVAERLHLRGGVSFEHKEFTNEVRDERIPELDTLLALETLQRIFEVGIGIRHPLTPTVGAYAELIVMDTRVDHDLPCVMDKAGTVCHKSSSPEWPQRFEEFGRETAAYFAQLAQGIPPAGPPPASRW